MIDFEKIGKRILEERKYLHRISQEKMALDLGMYQADTRTKILNMNFRNLLTKRRFTS